MKIGAALVRGKHPLAMVTVLPLAITTPRRVIGRWKEMVLLDEIIKVA